MAGDMGPLQHQVMGYDRAITMFSPDGRLLQVEYAKKTVRQGSTAMGFTCSDGVLFVADKRLIDPLIVPESVEKIWPIDDHVGITAAGIVSDARVLIERAQVLAQQHKVTYDSPIDILSVVKNLCDLKQLCTQSAGLRPFGVSLIIGGIDKDGPKIYETDPTGIYFRYKATVIGEAEPIIEKQLYKEYKETMKIQDALKIALKLLSKALDKNFSVERIAAAYIKTDEKKFKRVPRSEIEKVFSQIKTKKK